jgi:predicted transcriptional regulator
LRLAPETQERLSAIAASIGRPEAWVITQAIEGYLALQADHLSAIEAGIRAADAGQFVPHDAVAAWVESWDTANELPPPA